ncbi:MAG: ABC transporter substrate-binding protein [Chloroflexi bacterium]|nr:ABC transporter substrate-binding protein [Chloroflexota bacterium]
MRIGVMDRRLALRFLVGGGSAMLLAACTSAPVAPTAAPANPTSAPQPAATVGAAAQPAATAKPTATQAQPKSGGTLRLGMVGDVSTLDGHNTTPNQFDTTWSVFDRLISYDVKLQPQPELAESWDLSADLTQIKLNLRKGIQWHSGREFTSDDIKYNLLRVRDAKLQIPTLRNQSNWFTSIETPDKYSIVLKSDLPRPAIFDFFEYFNQVDQETMEGPNAKTASIGTGPFKFVEWVQGDHLTFTRNPNYWKSGRPYVDTFVASARDAQAMLVQLEAGALDVAKGPSPNDFARYRGEAAYQPIVHSVSGNYFLFGLNLGIPPLDNKQVRQALNYALDRNRFVETFMFGTGTAQSLPWPSSSPAFEASKQNFYTFDLDKAASLLKAAGVSELTLDCNVLNAWPQLVSFAPVYQADLAKIGVTLNVRSLELATWVDEAVNRKYKGMYLSNSTFAQLEPSSTLSNGRATDPNSNNSLFQNDAYSKLIAQASAEPDLAKRKAFYSQLNDILLDESFIMVLAGAPPTLVARANVMGIAPSAHDGFYYDNTFLA